MSGEVIAVDVYNLSVGGGGDDRAGEEFGRRARPVRDRAYGVCFDIHYGCPALHELAYCVKFGTAPGYLQGVICETE